MVKNSTVNEANEVLKERVFNYRESEMETNDPLEEQQTKLVNQSRSEQSHACPDAEVTVYWRLLPRFLESGGLRSRTCLLLVKLNKALILFNNVMLVLQVPECCRDCRCTEEGRLVHFLADQALPEFDTIVNSLQLGA